MTNICSWEDEDGWRLLQKWFQSSCDISVNAGGMFSDKHFSMKRGLITHLDPTRIRLRGEDGREFEMAFSEMPHFEDVVSTEIMASTPWVKGKFPEMLSLTVGWETWHCVGSIEIEGQLP